MFHKLSTWVLTISAALNVLASPLSISSYKNSAASALAERQFDCPPGIECGHGPVCTAELCDLPGCADAEVCQDSNPGTTKRSAASALGARQFGCPPGLKCGHGPECTAELCDLPGCADAEVCQNNQTVTPKRSAASALAERQFGCPPGLECGHGPVCTAELCNLPGCADADVCQDSPLQKRIAETDITHPVCDICIVGNDGRPVCGCATPTGGHKRREAEKVCPLYCIVTATGDTLCGCAAQTYEESH